MVSTSQLMRAEELLQLPDDTMRSELVRGEVRRMSPAGHQHGYLVVNITAPLAQHVRTHRLGRVYAAETGFLLARDPDTVRAPDVAFVQRARLAAVSTESGYWPGAPDFVAEVISPHDLYTDVDEKIGDWLQAGTQMVVIVNPRNQTVTVYRSLTNITVLTSEDTLDGANVIPGWVLPVADIFA